MGEGQDHFVRPLRYDKSGGDGHRGSGDFPSAVEAPKSGPVHGAVVLVSRQSSGGAVVGETAGKERLVLGDRRLPTEAGAPCHLGNACGRRAALGDCGGRGAPAKQELAWLGFWNAAGYIRLIAGQRDRWGALFTSPVRFALSLLEFLKGPGRFRSHLGGWRRQRERRR